MRRLLLVTLLLGLGGVLAELLLLAHTGDTLQLVPIGLICVVLAVLGWFGVSRSRASLRALQGVLALLLVSGMVGVWLHFGANVEWERESNPSLGGFELYRAALRGALPVLAPGAMVQLALIGIAFTFRHPVLTGTVTHHSTEQH